MSRLETNRIYDELRVIQIKAGDGRAADRLAVRWHPRLMRTARRLLRDDEQARDAVQETWTGICRGWMNLSDPAKFPAWAFGILHRKCADRIKKEQKARVRIFDGRYDQNLMIDQVAEHRASQMPNLEDRTAIRQAIDRLNPDHRVAAVLFFGEGLRLAEIAEVTNVPVGTVKSRIHTARKQIKLNLGQ